MLDEMNKFEATDEFKNQVGEERREMQRCEMMMGKPLLIPYLD